MNLRVSFFRSVETDLQAWDERIRVVVDKVTIHPTRESQLFIENVAEVRRLVGALIETLKVRDCDVWESREAAEHAMGSLEKSVRLLESYVG